MQITAQINKSHLPITDDTDSTRSLITYITDDVIDEIISFSDDIISELDLLRQQGFKISLDDFGTGYSSMSYLSSLEFDEIKIDRSFITKICSDKKTLLLVRAIVSMAQALESKVVAEGVETTEELDYLQQMGIDSIQGYLYSDKS